MENLGAHEAQVKSSTTGVPVKLDRLGRKNKGGETPVGVFVDAYRARFKKEPLVNPAAARNLHAVLNGYDPETCRALVEEYLSNREPFFEGKGHPMGLFTTWFRQRANRVNVGVPTSRPVAIPVSVSEIEEEFVGTEEEKARAVDWAKRNGA